MEINIPPLRERKGDIHLLFRKFASDFGQKYKNAYDSFRGMRLFNYYSNTDGLVTSGNCEMSQNKFSVLEEDRSVSLPTLNGYLPNAGDSNLPAVINKDSGDSNFNNEREILYKVLFDMKADLNDLKKLTLSLLKSNDTEKIQEENETLIRKIYGTNGEQVEEEKRTPLEVLPLPEPAIEATPVVPQEDKYHFAEEIQEEETLSLQEKEIELIKKSLERNRGKRKAAAAELGISERTLYRKIKQYDL